ncbi:MAG: hypothetical protein LBO74_02980, partial [Candidatus Symbiothrix sp.]|nr:hypothetical protein [Candidatus Symbiothrix sp.]
MQTISFSFITENIVFAGCSVENFIWNYGSKRHILLDIFSNISMPFYKFGDILFLEKIDNAVWGKFIQKRFRDTGKEISKKDAETVAGLVENHSYYVQQ